MTDKEIPQPILDLKTQVEDMMETARKVKGEDFASGVLFLLNAATTMKIVSKAVSAARQGAPLEVIEHLAEGVIGTIGAMTGAYLRSAGLSDDERAECIKFARNIDEKVGETEEALNKE